MTKWMHFPHHEPPDGVALYVRNWPFPGAAAVAMYQGGTAYSFECLGNGHVFPAAVAYQWRLAPSPLPDPPAPKPLRNSVFRDFLLYQPADQQLCWVRSCSEYSAPFKAVFLAAAGGGGFEAVELEGMVYPWWVIALWRPAAS